MKELKIKFQDDLFEKVEKVRKQESPSQRNKTFCRDLIMAMVDALEALHEKERKKNVRKRSTKRKKGK
jgi:metal-responsive CopG/Arc/MetJ family transcriptional regulator|tara:strand:- start:142 stop:345 length:204 start_codon:yes stop_codon:yes gene_type:complete